VASHFGEGGGYRWLLIHRSLYTSAAFDVIQQQQQQQQQCLNRFSFFSFGSVDFILTFSSS
jgi:hypothetical protein